MPVFQGLPAALDSRVVPWVVLPGLLVPGVGGEVLVDAVGDLPLQRSHRFTLGATLADLAIEVGAALAVEVADLRHGDHVERMVQRAVPST